MRNMNKDNNINLGVTSEELKVLNNVLCMDIDISKICLDEDIEKTKEIIEILRKKVNPINYVTLKDLNIVSYDNWYEERENYMLYVDCSACATNEVVDAFFGIDILTNGKPDEGFDFYYVLSFGYNILTKGITLYIDFNSHSEKFPKGFCKEYSLYGEDYNFVYEFLTKSAKEYTGMSLEALYANGCKK